MVKLWQNLIAILKIMWYYADTAVLFFVNNTITGKKKDMINMKTRNNNTNYSNIDYRGNITK